MASATDPSTAVAAATAAPTAVAARSVYAPPVLVTPEAAAAAAIARNYSWRWWETGALAFPVACLTQVTTMPFLVHGVDHRPSISMAQVRADPALPWRGYWNEMRTAALRVTGVFASKQFLRSSFDIFGEPASTLEDFSRNFAAGGCAGLLMMLPWYMTELHEKRMTGGSRTAKLPAGTFGRGWNMKSNPASVKFIEFTQRNGWWGRGGAHAGAGLASMRELVQRGLYFGLYDTIVAHHSDMGYGPRFALAYAVSFGSGLVVHPLAEIHERTQYWRGPQRKFVNAREAYRKLTAVGGPMTLWHGAMGRLARTAVPAAMMLVGVDAVKQFYRRLRTRDESLPKTAEVAKPAKPARVHYPIAGTAKTAVAPTADATPMTATAASS